MTKALELRERLKAFYGRLERYIKPALRFLVSLMTFLTINGTIGYMKKLNQPAVALVLSLICTFLPANAIPVLAALLILVHLYSLAVEACLVALLLFVIMFFMYYRFAPKNGFQTVLTPILCLARIPQVMPVASGLLKHPGSIFSMACGLVTFYYLRGVRQNEALLSTPEADEKAVSKFTLVLQQIAGNKELYLILAAFALTTLVVYILRRLDINRAWTIANVTGSGVNLLLLLGGSYLLDTPRDIPFLALGSAASVAVGLVLEFFLYNLDYSRVERVQFEDDEYYYFVKAVPKASVSVKDKRVKQINSRNRATINKQELAQELEIDQELFDD